MDKEINLIIAEDHPLARLGVKCALEREPGIKVAKEVDTWFGLVEELFTNEYDLIMLDIDLPQKNGIEIIKQLKERGIDTPVLVHSIHSERDYALRALNAGARGYVKKDASPDELIKAVKKVSSGRAYMSDCVQELLLNDRFNNVPHSKLTDKEYGVMLALAKDYPLTEIGEMFNISPKTVSTHRTRILEKMDFKTNVDIALYVYKNRLDPEQ